MKGGNVHRLRTFVRDFADLLATGPSEPVILADGGALLQALVETDDWLPDAYAQPSGAYSQHLLHCDSLERFSVVSCVWSPGGGTPVHDHTVWGLVGQLRGAEISQPFTLGRDSLVPLDPVRVEPGQVQCVSPQIGDIHRVSNALEFSSSISIHVYGANIGTVERSVFSPSAQRRPFVSGYTNATTPNIWRGVDPLPDLEALA